MPDEKLEYVGDLEGFDDIEEPGYRLPKMVVCIVCGTEYQSAKHTHLKRIYKIMSKMFNISVGQAEKIDMEDDKFQKAKEKHDKEYKCKKCRGGYTRKKPKIPVILEDGSQTTDYSCMK